MRPIYALLLVIFSAHLLAHAETLQQLLEKQGVPA